MICSSLVVVRRVVVGVVGLSEVIVMRQLPCHGFSRPVGMRGLPVPGNVNAFANPPAVVLGSLVQKMLQPHDAAWSTLQAAVHAHSGHFGCVQPLGTLSAYSASKLLRRSMKRSPV